MAAIQSFLTDLAYDMPSGRALWALLVIGVVAVTVTLTGLTAHIAVWVRDELARGRRPAPGSRRPIV